MSQVNVRYGKTNAVINVHGTTDRERLKKATERFLKKADAEKRRNEKIRNSTLTDSNSNQHNASGF